MAAPITVLRVASLIVSRSGLVGISFLLSITNLFVTEIVTAALIYATFRISVSQAFGINEMYQIATDRLGSLIAYSFRYIGAVILLAITIVGIPWAIRVGVRWWFGTQAIVLNNETPKEAISHSCRLVSGVGWPLFWTFVLLSIPFWLLLIFSFVTRGSLAFSLAPIGISAIVTPILSAFWTALYLQLDEQDKRLRMPEPAP